MYPSTLLGNSRDNDDNILLSRVAVIDQSEALLYSISL